MRWVAPDRSQRTPLGLSTETRLAAAIAFLLGLGYVFVVPLGEAPDEGAHLFYVTALLEHGRAPDFDLARAPQSYEAHQPPLDYALLALGARALGVDRIDYDLVRDPRLDFDRAGSRAFLSSSSASESRRYFYLLRALHAAWAPLIVLLVGATIAQLASVPASLCGAAVWGVALCPQLLFTCATVNNDGLTIALATACVFFLVRQVARSSRPLRGAMAASVVAGLAVWAKLSAAFLGAPLLLAAIRVRKVPRSPRLVAALLLPAALGVATVAAWVRGHAAVHWIDLPSAAAHDASSALTRLATDWTWPLTVWRSWWAKFGWFNLPLPALAYLVFVPASAAAAVGTLRVLRRRPAEEAVATAAGRIALAAVVANGLLLTLYMLLVAWQPQGRLMLPSIGPVAVLVAIGLHAFEPRIVAPVRERLAPCFATVMIAVNLFALAWIHLAYRAS